MYVTNIVRARVTGIATSTTMDSLHPSASAMRKVTERAAMNMCFSSSSDFSFADSP